MERRTAAEREFFAIGFENGKAGERVGADDCARFRWMLRVTGVAPEAAYSLYMQGVRVGIDAADGRYPASTADDDALRVRFGTAFDGGWSHGYALASNHMYKTGRVIIANERIEFWNGVAEGIRDYRLRNAE